MSRASSKQGPGSNWAEGGVSRQTAFSRSPRILHPRHPVMRGQCLSAAYPSAIRIYQNRACSLQGLDSSTAEHGGCQVILSILGLLTFLSHLGNLVLWASETNLRCLRRKEGENHQCWLSPLFGGPPTWVCVRIPWDDLRKGWLENSLPEILTHSFLCSFIPTYQALF